MVVSEKRPLEIVKEWSGVASITIIFSERLNSYSVLSTKECHDEETRIDKHSHQRNNNYIEVLQEVCSSCLDEDDSDSDFIPQTIGESCVHEGNHEKDSTQKDATSSPD